MCLFSNFIRTSTKKVRITINTPIDSSVNIKKISDVIDLSPHNFSRPNNYIIIVKKGSKRFIVYHCVIRVARAQFYGSHWYKNFISRKLSRISNNCSVEVLEINNIKESVTELTQIVNVASLVQILTRGVNNKNIFINNELVVKGIYFVDFILDNTSKSQNKYLINLKLIVISRRFPDFYQSNSEIHILIINDLNKQQLIFRRVKEMQYKINTPILNNWLEHKHLEFSKINRNSVIKDYKLDLERYYSLLCLVHILIIREDLFTLTDKSQSLHISGKPSTGKSSLINKIISIFGSEIFYFVNARRMIDFTNYEPAHRPILVFDDNLGKERSKYIKIPEHYTFLKKSLGSDRRFFAIRKYKEAVQVYPLPAIILSNYSYLFIRDAALKSRLKVVNFSETSPIYWANLKNEDFKKIIYYASIEVACYYRQSSKEDMSLNFWSMNLNYGNFYSWKTIKPFKYYVDNSIFKSKK